MDAGVYDHIQEEALKRDADSAAGGEKGSSEEAGSLTTDLQETYRSFTTSPWGARLGGFWGTVNKQAASYIQEAQKEASVVSGEAFKGFEDLKTSLVGRARALSTEKAVVDEKTRTAGGTKTGKESEEKSREGQGEGPDGSTDGTAILSRFKDTASRRLAELQKAEDAADEALLKFGTNIRNFLRDAVTVTPPSDEAPLSAANTSKGSVLFESKDSEGKRVIHTTRFDAQLHVIHCSLDSFTKDPVSGEYEKWAEGFNVEKNTEQIAEDLKQYEELRRAMEKLVPEKVEYEAFWRRYYFLRMVIESEEKRRREMLKAAASKSSAEDADLAWDEESDEEGGPSTPQPRSSGEQPTADTPMASSSAHLKEPRTSHDGKSTAGSESSYDLVSGVNSAAPGSPGSPGEKKEDPKREGAKKDESDEEDWE